VQDVPKDGKLGADEAEIIAKYGADTDDVYTPEPDEADEGATAGAAA
jgi:hypothetical protein